MTDAENPKPRRLLVDDEEGVRMSLRALLEREYRIASVPSGEAALEELPRFIVRDALAHRSPRLN